MGIESLVPFGLNIENEQLVDVGNVDRGNACGCICPSCKTPLVARHGDKKEWHFAHRSQKVHGKTRKECEYSFSVSVRLMIRQLSSDGLKFRTPRLQCSLPAFSEDSYESADFSYQVTKESLLILEKVQVGVHFCGVTVDVLGLVEDVPFVVFVTYKDRSLPSELKNPSLLKCGVIELNVDALPRLFKQEENGQYKGVLRRYIENETDGKRWAYHPREQRLKNAAFKKRRSWLLQQQIAAKPNTTNKHNYQNTVKPIEFSSYTKSAESVKRIVPSYRCTKCKSEWTGLSKLCVICNSYSFTTKK